MSTDPHEPASPSAATASEVTELLGAWRDGRADAGEKLMEILYGELHRLARRKMELERPGVTLQTTALVHEAFLRLVDQRDVRFRDRGHFLALAATMMRRVLVDRARKRDADKRGSGQQPVALEAAEELGAEPSLDVLDLDRALERLAATCPRPARVIELRLFAGLGLEEIASLLEVDERTVRRDWTFAVAWLKRALAAA